ncbi:Variant-specific surface protein, partial [Giardia duodenalis]
VQGLISKFIGQIVAASDPTAHLSSDMDLHPPLGGCYSASAAPGSGVCREARDRACVEHAEEARAEARKPRSGCQAQDTGGPETCHTCGAVIGGVSYCSQCNVDSSGANGAPTDGVCTADNAVCNAKSNGVCTTCTGSSFMFKGGCYRTGQDPGQTMCTNAASGVCSAAADGYFVPPAEHRDNAHQSVIPCGDVEEITVGNSHKYKGVAHCTQCNTPNAASDTTTAVAATCTACEDGYFVNTNACEACGDENCATCAAEGTGKCSKCKATGTKTYLKVESGDTGTCVEASGCGSGFFPKDDAESGNKCILCGEANNGGIQNCAECSLLPSASRAGAILISCTKCSKNNLSPLKNECMANCPAGTYANSNICKPCHTSCSSCSDTDESSCTACYPGYVLSKGADTTKGTCIRECTGALMAHCKADGCTLDVGGSKYCDACEDGYAPIDGVCTAMSAGARDASGCKASGGKCTACTGTNYALLSGGCYNTKALPGSAVCTQADSNGQCQTCANGQNATSGNCPACAEGCAECVSSISTCTECLAGYYLSGTKCVKCDKDDNAITGVPNCVSCAPPTTPPGPVTCYVTQTPTVDPADPSVNKGGLPSGAIAGISVAVIAVVGGLVGFLCWWFVCRGKA